MSSSATAAASSSTVPPHVIKALTIFTIAMVGAPLLSFYVCMNFIFAGNSQWSGLVAAVVANVVVVGYVVFAWKEDGMSKTESVEESKKSK
ncbi:hypothetical protein V1512DRAFT_256186 [Lipomyces arxii]|uniref:uncharacterized protein n=1 Tax=Lipomyces arxii TaxID=56418 RepID=UPI0034CE8917